MARSTVAAAVEAISEHRGNVSAASDALGCSRPWISTMAERHEKVALAIEEARARTLDTARDNLFKAVDDGDLDQSRWVLARLDPEFREKQQVDQTGKMIIEVRRKSAD